MGIQDANLELPAKRQRTEMLSPVCASTPSASSSSSSLPSPSSSSSPLDSALSVLKLALLQTRIPPSFLLRLALQRSPRIPPSEADPLKALEIEALEALTSE